MAIKVDQEVTVKADQEETTMVDEQDTAVIDETHYFLKKQFQGLLWSWCGFVNLFLFHYFSPKKKKIIVALT